MMVMLMGLDLYAFKLSKSHFSTSLLVLPSIKSKFFCLKLYSAVEKLLGFNSNNQTKTFLHLKVRNFLKWTSFFRNSHATHNPTMASVIIRLPRDEVLTSSSFKTISLLQDVHVILNLPFPPLPLNSSFS
jgi:hypothetical protein